MNRLAINVEEKDVLPLNQKEIDLIYLLRNVFRYGSVEIVMRDGVPVDLIRTVQRIRLGDLSTDEIDSLK